MRPNLYPLTPAICAELATWRQQGVFLKRQKTAQDIADALGIPGRVIREIEAGSRLNDTFGLVSHLSIALGLTPNDLLICERQAVPASPRDVRHRRARTWFRTILTPEEKDSISKQIEMMVEQHYDAKSFAGPLLIGE